jgi:hypothetical protein
MFGNNKGSDYSQVNLDEFSDDSSHGEDDFVQNSMRNQQVRLLLTTRDNIYKHPHDSSYYLISSTYRNS